MAAPLSEKGVDIERSLNYFQFNRDVDDEEVGIIHMLLREGTFVKTMVTLVAFLSLCSKWVCFLFLFFVLGLDKREGTHAPINKLWQQFV